MLCGLDQLRLWVRVYLSVYLSDLKINQSTEWQQKKSAFEYIQRFEEKKVTKHLTNKYIKTKIYYLAFKVHSTVEFQTKKNKHVNTRTQYFVYFKKNHNNIQILIYFNEMTLMRQPS